MDKEEDFGSSFVWKVAEAVVSWCGEKGGFACGFVRLSVVWCGIRRWFRSWTVVGLFVVWEGRWIRLWCGSSWCGKGGGFVCGAGVLWFQSVVHSVVSCVLRHSLSERLVSIYLHLVVNFTFGEYSDGMICFCFGASEVVLRCFVVCVVCFCRLFTFSCAEHKIVVCVFPRRARWTSQMHVFCFFVVLKPMHVQDQCVHISVRGSRG